MLTNIWTVVLALISTPLVTPIVNYHKLAIKDMKASVLVHVVGTKEGKLVSVGCSGTYISPTQIITAGHCFNGYEVKKVWVRGINDPVGYRVHIEKVDMWADLAILDAPFKHAYAKIGQVPDIGEPVLNIGSPLDFEFAVSEGIVAITSFRVPAHGGKFMVTTAMANHGSSGGGAFNKKGQLVGVNTLIVGPLGWQGISLAVDADTVKDFLRG